jgi:tripartite-type tricarboxylate transporter receptor subunit TctC
LYRGGQFRIVARWAPGGRKNPEATTMPAIIRSLGLTFTLAIAAGLAAAPQAAAQDEVAKFYKGKNVQAIVGYAPGSTFELYLRMVTRHIGKHIPGNPNIILQHMPGAGSLKATNYLAAIAPKDGTVFGMPNPVNTIEPLIDPKNSRFDPRTFVWLGSLNAEISTCGFWTKDLRTLDDMRKREVVVGSTGPASGSTVDARMLGALLGLKIKVVPGYPALNDIRLASERGETDGFCGLLVSALKTDYWEAYKSGRMAVAVQMGLSKHKELPDIPNAYEFVTKEEDRQLFQLIFGPWTYGRPLFAPPGTPPERVAALRGAVAAMLKDPAYLAETQKLNMEIQPIAPETIGKLVDQIFGTPAPVIERARLVLGVANR